MFKKLVDYIKRENQKKLKVLKRSKELSPGEYRFHESRKFAYLNNERTENNAKWLLENDPLMRKPKKLSSIKHHLISSKVFVAHGGEGKRHFHGTIHFFTKNHKQDRVFDVENLKVKAFFSDKQDKEEYVNTYNRFSPYFRQPQIIESTSSTVTEELIAFDEEWELNPSILRVIFDDYIKYYSEAGKTDSEEISFSSFLTKLQRDEEVNFFKSSIDPELLNTEFTTIDGHGDLRKNNLLYQKEHDHLYYIDWEFSRKYSLIYDIFFLMYHEALLNNNDSLLNAYKEGKFDSQLTTVFSLFDKTYDPALKKSYLGLFALEHYVKKVNCNGKFIQRYKQLLEKN